MDLVCACLPSGTGSNLSVRWLYLGSYGRRYVALTGTGGLVVAMIICSTAKSMNVFIGIEVLIPH